MKNNKTYLCLLFYLVSCTLFFASCEVKDNTPCATQHTYHQLKDWEKTTVPYFVDPSFDTISFLNPNQDTIRFRLMTVDSSWYVEDDNRNPNPDGCPDLHYYETLTGKYQAIKGNEIFKVAIKAKSKSRLTPHVEITLGTYLFTCSLVTFGQKNYVDYVGNYTVNGIEHKEAFYVYNLNETQIKAYMNSTSGLILIDDEELNRSYSILQ